MDRKVVVITGAAAGIGKATAHKFAANGYYVVALDLNAQGLTLLKAELAEANCLALSVDVTSSEAMKMAMQQISTKTGGKIDVLCVNAGVLVQEKFENAPLLKYKRMLEINNYGAVNTIYAALPLLKATPKSRVIITSSSSAVFGMPHFAVYSATKSFVKNLTEALATEFKEYGIKVCDVMPLFVSTDMFNEYSDKFKKQIKPNQTPESIASMIFSAHKNMRKLHYYRGFSQKTMMFLYRILPAKLFAKVIKSYLKV